jgi:hypothetical protein
METNGEEREREDRKDLVHELRLNDVNVQGQFVDLFKKEEAEPDEEVRLNLERNNNGRKKDSILAKFDQTEIIEGFRIRY